MGMVTGAFPSRGLVYPKTDEKPPYMTWQEVERRLTPQMSAKEKSELWDCLYLTLTEIEKLLALVKRNAGHGWISPLFAFAAHTGARRSEMLRVLVSDLDLAPTAITRDEAHDHFKRTLAGSKWGVIRGWHIFRHSFISLCASKGTDQRLIDEWVGHQTEEQRKRYRHLLPSTQQQAIRSVFERQ